MTDSATDKRKRKIPTGKHKILAPPLGKEIGTSGLPDHTSIDDRQELSHSYAAKRSRKSKMLSQILISQTSDSVTADGQSESNPLPISNAQLFCESQDSDYHDQTGTLIVDNDPSVDTTSSTTTTLGYRCYQCNTLISLSTAYLLEQVSGADIPLSSSRQLYICQSCMNESCGGGEDVCSMNDDGVGQNSTVSQLDCDQGPPLPSIDPLPDSDLTAMIDDFHSKSNLYPDQICFNCQTMRFKKQVNFIPADNPAETKTVCKRCLRYLKQGKMSPIAVANGLDCGELPDHLVLNPTEARLISQRYIFCKIVSLPAGGQKGIVGRVINVPIDPSDNCLQLPRNLDESGLIPVTLKRDISHKTVVVQDTVRPKVCIDTLQYLKTNNPYYKDVTFSTEFVRGNYAKNPDFFALYFEEDPYVMSYSIIDLVLSAVFGLPSVGDPNYETCLQDRDPHIEPENSHLQPNSMVFAPGQGKTPKPFFNDIGNEVLSFPTKFPFGKGHFGDIRNVKLTMKDYAETRLFHKNRTWAMSPEYIFYMQHLVEAEQINSCIKTFCRKGKRTLDGQIINAGLVKKYFEGDPNISSNIQAWKFLEKVRGAPAYWRAVRNDWLAVVEQKGQFTWFVTVSFNDLYYSIPAIAKAMNPSLIDQAALDEYCRNLTWYQRHEMLVKDPVIAMRMFGSFANNVVTILLKGGALGPLEACLGRNEFAHRGSPHLHFMLKILGAPILDPCDSSTHEPFYAFVDKYCTTQGQYSPEEEPLLAELINLQIHNHRATCQKYGKEECRFHYPRPVAEHTHIVVNDDETKKSRKQKIVLKREPGDEWVNSYNKTLLKAVRSNIDVQPIVAMWDVIHYIIAYATKNEKAMTIALKGVMKSINNQGNRAARDQLKELGDVFTKARDLSLQESINRTLPHIPMKYSDPETVFVDASMPQDRHGILKSRTSVSALTNDDTDVWVSGPREKYAARPDEYKNLCFASFSANWATDSYMPKIRDDNNDSEIPTSTAKQGVKCLPRMKLKNKLGVMRQRKTEIVINYYRPSRQNDPEKWYYSKICLFYPWTNPAEIQGDFDTLEASFVDKYDIIKPNILHFQKIPEEDLDRIINECHDYVTNVEFVPKPDCPLDQDNYHTAPPNNLKDTPSEPTKNVQYHYVEPSITTDQFNEQVANLNPKQREFYDMIDEHSTRTAKGLPVKQLVHFLSGAGGVGKSYLINTIRHCINRKFADSRVYSRIFVSALTGVASANVAGPTIHTGLGTDTQRGSMSYLNFTKLGASKLAAMRKVFDHVQYLIIDECSMMGFPLLCQINARLNQLKAHINGPSKDVWYGGINVIFCGDFHQLPPVQAKAIYSPAITHLLLGRNLWTDFVTFTELTDIVRTKGDDNFTALCHRLREGKHTDEDVKQLESRVFPKPPYSEMLDYLTIFPTNAECANHNRECMKELQAKTEMFTFIAYDDFVDSKLKTTSSIQSLMSDDQNKTSGLPTSVTLGVGCRIMIRANVDVLDKIVNGSTGSVTFIDFSRKTRIPPVYVKFDDPLAGINSGLKHVKCVEGCLDVCPKLGSVRIDALEKQFISPLNNVTWVKRYQLPLNLSWASTVHKVQGLTVKKAWVSLGLADDASKYARWNAGQAYTAISRFQSLAAVKFLKFDKIHIKTSKEALDEYDRLRALPKFVNCSCTGVCDCTNALHGSDLPQISQDIPQPSTATLPPLMQSPPPMQSPRVQSCDIPLQPCTTLKEAAVSISMDSPPSKRKKRRTLNNNHASEFDFNMSIAPYLPGYIGRARVVDFLDHSVAHDVVTELRSAGLYVSHHITTQQQRVTCGYNCALTAAKLAARQSDWLHIDVSDCCDFTPENRASDMLSRMVELADRHLSRPPPHVGDLLFDNELSSLFAFYSSIFYGMQYSTEERTRFVSWAYNRSAFLSNVRDHLANRTSKGAGCPLQICILNTDDHPPGSHWLLVLYELFPSSLPLTFDRED